MHLLIEAVPVVTDPDARVISAEDPTQDFAQFARTSSGGCPQGGEGIGVCTQHQVRSKIETVTQIMVGRVATPARK